MVAQQLKERGGQELQAAEGLKEKDGGSELTNSSYSAIASAMKRFQVFTLEREDNRLH